MPEVASEAPASALPMPHVDGVGHRLVNVGGTTFHVAEAGDGPPLVLLHGWPQHWWSWREIIPALAERYRVICPDFRGLGWSAGAEGSFRVDALVLDLVALLDELGHERVRLIGHDWGLTIGYRACLTWPERFERFVALAGIHPWQAGELRLASLRRIWHVWAISALGPLALTRFNLGERELRAWRHAGEFTEDEAAAYLGPLRRQSTVSATVRYYRELVSYEIPFGIRNYAGWRLTVPTLQLQGANDPLTSFTPDNYRLFADDMKLDAITDCGHYIPEEAPEALLERLDSFL